MNKQELYQYMIGVMFMVTILFLVRCCSRSGVIHDDSWYKDEYPQNNYDIEENHDSEGNYF